MTQTKITVKMTAAPRNMRPTVSHLLRIDYMTHTVTATYSTQLQRLVVIIDSGAPTAIENVPTREDAEREIAAILRGVTID